MTATRSQRNGQPSGSARGRRRERTSGSPQAASDSSAYDRLPAERRVAATAAAKARRAVPALVEQLTRALGPPIATPELVAGDDGRLVRAEYRVFRWPCPACHAGYDDPNPIYSPFVVDSDGRVWCEAPYCSGLDAVLRDLLRAAA